MNSTNTNTVQQKCWTNKSLVLIIFMLFLSTGAFAQGKKLITGIIYDNTNVPLPGVNILEAGTTNAVATDENGKFVIEANIGSTLVISSIGFTTQNIVVDASTANLDIHLAESDIMLDSVELVAVGYGTMRKSDLTGAISTVRGEDLVKGVITSTEQALQGKVAGLTVSQSTGDPSSGATMRLRGGTSLTASNNPLIVVDGIDGVDINIIQPSDIKSVDVLKDASATAIYGSRGANGVIIITTKSGKKGTSFVYNGYTGISEASNNLDLLSAD
jgi:iron complex outermembrane receptor protein